MRINFDANASVRPIPEVLAYLKAFDGAALNPSSVHSFGQKAKAIIDEAKSEIRTLLKLDHLDKIIFTSGATESNNAALLKSPNFSGNLCACSAVEHHAVLEPLQACGKEIKTISPEKIEDCKYLKESLDDQLSLFALMAANNETGQIFDIAKVSATVRKISPRVRIHCDAVQAIGKYELNFHELGVDTLAFSGHKIGALSGIGVLVISKHCHLDPWILGGPQQDFLRAGTENIIGIKSLELSISSARKRLINGNKNLLEAKNRFQTFFNSLENICQINNFGSKQLDNTLSISFTSVQADDLVVALDLEGISISAGSACNSGRPNPSHVLLAHGFSKQQAKQTIRVSFEPDIKEAEIETGIKVFSKVLERIAFLRAA
jgi:cysteine desulfurase